MNRARPGSRAAGAASRRVDRPRAAALAVLTAVRAEDAYANLVLPGILAQYRLTGRDAAFTTELVSGTIRRRGTYDAILATCIDRGLRKVEAGVLDVLRLGCHQLLSMRVPAHAAISTSVDLVRSTTGPGAAGFANAVLRSVARQDLEAWIAQLTPDTLPDDERAAIAHSHPVWVVDQLRAAAPEDDLDAVLAANNVPPRVTLVARPGLATRDELPGTPTRYSPYGVVAEPGDPSDVPAVAERRAGVQDEGSQLVAHALASAPLEGPDRLWLDLCAGPGGKAALLAALAAQRGARLVAVEQHLHRARLVERALSGLAASGTASAHPPVVLNADGTAAPLRPAGFDRILLDAPCSGLGALRRRPEARWRRSADDLVGLVMLQRRLLRSALDLVRPGGVVLYATCSPVRIETGEVISSVVRGVADVSVEDVRGLLPGVEDADGPVAGTAQLWPHRHGTDAMFLALLRKQG
ncbi:RsmB/NOP family class I SAM-dependent RNA methyltransferase [Nocardioides sambongensis]|uniref:RsmB/NOP family class I SAM-dependent RNA methyltransferase n=1 Tax=Nocardioides sambongensis TaxID=2589074 RepID=UPI001126C8B6|nr:transcription antitermination factor NusB [Nocardioides sambongensis]